LLAGLYEFDWLETVSQEGGLPQVEAGGGSPHGHQSLRRLFPESDIQPLGRLTHRFTHLQWHLSGFAVTLPEDWSGQLPNIGGEWVDEVRLASLPFATALAGYRDQVLLQIAAEFL